MLQYRVGNALHRQWAGNTIARYDPLSPEEVSFREDGEKIRGNVMSGSEPREVYVVMLGDRVEGVYTDKLRAEDACVGIARAQFEHRLADSRDHGFRYINSWTPIVWPTIKAAKGSLDD